MTITGGNDRHRKTVQAMRQLAAETEIVETSDHNPMSAVLGL